METKGASLLAVAATITAALVVTPEACAGPVDGFARTPPLGSTKNNLVTYMERTAVWPAAISPPGNSLSFDYIVDSQQDHDVLRLYINGVEQDLLPREPATGISGLNRAGRRLVRLPQGGGSFTVRFAYEKNAGVTHGRDLVIIDNVWFSADAAGGPFERHRFNTNDSLGASGWVAGGSNGGFVKGTPQRERAAVRPREQAYVDGTMSYMERHIVLPACWGCGKHFRGSVEFDYYVDSEVNGDWLRVRRNGVQQDLDPTRPGVQGITGRNRSGSHRIALPGPGTHAIRFEYAKNASVSVGRDTARIDQVRVLDGDGELIEFHDFTARDLNRSPIRCTISGQSRVPIEWQGGSSGLGNDATGWAPRAETPPLAYVPMQTAGEALKPGYKVFGIPGTMVDGVVHGAHYDNATSAQLLDFRSHQVSGTLRMVGDSGTGSLFIGVSGESASPTEQGNERGRLLLYLDGERTYAMRDRVTSGSGTCTDVAAPGPEDRRLRLAYTIPAQSSEAVIPDVQELKGDCGGWVPLSGSPSWLAVAEVSEPEPGRIDVEVELAFPAESMVLSDKELGLGLRYFRQAATAAPGTSIIDERWPDGTYGGPTEDVYSWATIRLAVPQISKYYHRAENPFRGVLTPSHDPYRFLIQWGR